MSTSERFPRPTRRHFLLQVLATAAAGGCGAGGSSGSSDESSEGGSSGGSSGGPPTTGGEPTTGETGGTSTGGVELPGDPFRLGIASGDPLPDSVILWTRLAPDPTVGDGGMPDEVVTVLWELASDEAFSQDLVAGEADAEPKFGHSLHVDVQGLAPDRWYYYRFKVGDWTSPVGRTRTLPAADASPERLKFATVCCQSYADGYWTAYPHLTAGGHDLVIHLGDYIYEDANTGPVRSHGGSEPTTLAEYRVRYGLYKVDAALQAAHAAAPWAMIWDDHEVENNYAGAVSQDDAPTDEFLLRRAAAYQAYYEHMPLRLPPPEGPDFKIYHALKWGDLAEFWLLDTRQYRDDQNCGDIDGMGCAGWDTWEGTLLGAEQEQWLFAGMKASAAIWKVIAQQLIFSTVDSGGNLVNFDQWDGYPVARQRILDFLVAEQIADVVVLSGDFHLGGVGDLTADAHDQDSPVVAAEVVTTSMGSLGDIPAETLEAVVGPLKNIKYVNAHSRGYSSHELTREVYTVRMVIADTVEAPTSPTSVEFEGYIDAGTPGLRPTP